MKVREVSGSLVVTLPKPLCTNFDITSGDNAQATFSRGRIILDVTKGESPRKQLIPYGSCDSCEKEADLGKIHGATGLYCEECRKLYA